MIKILLTLVLCLFCTVVSAAPTVTGVSYSNGVITVNGSGFKTHPDFNASQPFLNTAWSNFESGLSGGNMAPASVTLNWRILSTGNRPNSTKFAEKWCNPEVPATSRRGGDMRVSSVSTLSKKYYWSFYFKMKNMAASKFSRLWIAFSQTNFYISTGDANTTVRGNAEYTPWGSSNTYWGSSPSLGTGNWHRIELYADPTSGEGRDWEGVAQGTVKLYIDGKFYKTIDNWVPADFNASTTSAIWEIGGMLNCDIADGGLHYDDVYFSQTQARIEIGNASTWDSTTVRELQIPTAWGTGSVTATANNGAFAPGSVAWLYLVDEDGVVSNAGAGNQITIGANIADTTGPILGDPSIPNGAIGIAPNTPFTVPANENLDCTTSTASTINPSPVAAICIGNALTHTPTGQSYNTTYTVTITTALKDTAGNPMLTQRTFTYTTAIDEGTVIEEDCSQDNWHLCSTLEEVNAANLVGVPEKTIYFWKEYSRTIPEPSFSSNIVTQTNLAAPYTGTPSGWGTYSTATAAEYGTYLANGQQIYWPMGILDNSTMVWAINILPGNVGQLHVSSSISGINLTESGTHVGTITVGEIVDHGWYLSAEVGANAVTINGPVLAQFITTKYSKTNSTGMQMGVRASGTSVRMVQ